MKKIHYTDSYLLSPYHPVTVHVIGAGGTGSQVATNLARMDMRCALSDIRDCTSPFSTPTPFPRRISGDSCSPPPKSG